MEKFRYKVAAFMYGRNGADQLYRAQVVTYIALCIVNLFAGSLIINLLIWLLFGWSMYRFFSRNLYKRQAENIRYMQLADKAKKFFLLRKNMIRDCRTNVYKKCPQCGKWLRLPRKKGSHNVDCPICRHSFGIKIHF
ncbi:MAG: hypothetical protein ACI4KF_11765 [Huintestinicola sp.]